MQITFKNTRQYRIEFYVDNPPHRIAFIRGNGDFEAQDSLGISCYKQYNKSWVIIDSARALQSLMKMAEAVIISYKKE